MLSVQIEGSGSVQSQPSGIDCGATCHVPFPYNSVVTLSASPSTGWVFDGWVGCTSATATCQVTMDTIRIVTARFVPEGAAGNAIFEHGFE